MTLLECAQSPQFDAKHTHGIKRMATALEVDCVCLLEKKEQTKHSVGSALVCLQSITLFQRL